MGADLSGKRALVTGSAKRIGREIALALAREGVNIIVHYHRSLKEAANTSEEIQRTGVLAWMIRADLGNPDDYNGLIRRGAETAGGPIDFLVNSASIFPENDLESVDYRSYSECLQVNAWAPFVLSRDFHRIFGRGKIINIVDSRVSGFDFTHVSYLWSKHVLLAMTRDMALEFAPHVSVNGVNPGLILPPPGKEMSYLEKMDKTVPMKKHGEPRDISEAVLFLLKSDFITGEVIDVDGGRHLWEYTSGPHPD